MKYILATVMLVLVVATPVSATQFEDVPDSHTFADDIVWLANAGITRGCNPPENDRFCPDDAVTREQMAAFLHRALDDNGGAPAGIIYFTQARALHQYDIDAEEDRFLQQLAGSDSGAFFAPDGSTYVSTRLDLGDPEREETVFLHRLSTRGLVTQFKFPGQLQNAFHDGTPEGGVQTAGIRTSPEGQYFSAVVLDFPNDSPLKVTDRTGAVVWQWGAERNVNQLRGHDWSPDGSLVVTGVIDGTPAMAIVEDVTDPNPQLRVVRTFNAVWEHIPDQLAISADGERVAYSLNGSIWMGSLRPNANDHRLLVTGTEPIHHPAFSPDGKWMAMSLEYSPIGGEGFLHIVKIPATGSTHIAITGPTEVPNQDGLPVRVEGFWSGMIWLDG